MNEIEKVGEPRRLDMLLDLPLDVSVELGRTRMSIQELLALAPGSVIELDKVAGEPLDILMNGRLLEANLHRDPAKAQEAARVFAPIADGFREAVARLAVEQKHAAA